MFTRRPQTHDEIREEIAALEGRRDRMLAMAPKHVIGRRAILPVMLLMVLVPIAASLSRGTRVTWQHSLILGVFAVLVGSAVWKAWRPGYDPKNLWDASDRLGYDGDSPRDLQRRIESLEAQLRTRDV